MKEYTEIERDAIREIDKFDVDDYLAFGRTILAADGRKIHITIIIMLLLWLLLVTFTGTKIARIVTIIKE